MHFELLFICYFTKGRQSRRFYLVDFEFVADSNINFVIDKKSANQLVLIFVTAISLFKKEIKAAVYEMSKLIK